MSSKDEEMFEAPQEFRPDRWERGDSEKIHPFSFLPFGFGPRACFGQGNAALCNFHLMIIGTGRRLAELELFVLLAKILPKYHLATNVKEMKARIETFLAPNLPLHINFRRRN